MKRFWLVLLALGMLFAFSSSVLAADVKFTGSYYAAGMYLNKVNVNKITTSYGYAVGYNSATAPVMKTGVLYGDSNSTAFYFQRLRVGMYFVVTPALSLVTRFDAMERAWGAPRSNAATYPISADVASSGTVAENENIAFDWAYIQYVSPIGAFLVGYQQDGAWGTVFGDNSIPLAKIQYVIRTGPVTAGAYAGKVTELSHNAKYARTSTDVDDDKYVAFVDYAVNKDIKVGLLGAYYRYAGFKDANTTAYAYPAVNPYLLGNNVEVFALLPYFKAKIGPVSLEGEVNYAWGKLRYEDGMSPAGYDKLKIKNLSAYLNAMADLGMFYVGGTFAYISGDKPNTGDKVEGGLLNGGIDWNPCLILFNQDLNYWAGSIYGYPYANTGLGTVPTNMNSPMSNAWFGQAKVGVRPIPALDIMMALAYAEADKRPGTAAQVTSKDYGWELDVTATYAITNNLSYMLGAGYLWTGDYFEGYNPSGALKVRDNYMVINKLTLTF
jgi:hypothetical protein